MPRTRIGAGPAWPSSRPATARPGTARSISRRVSALMDLPPREFLDVARNRLTREHVAVRVHGHALGEGAIDEADLLEVARSRDHDTLPQLIVGDVDDVVRRDVEAARLDRGPHGQEAAV